MNEMTTNEPRPTAGRLSATPWGRIGFGVGAVLGGLLGSRFLRRLLDGAVESGLAGLHAGTGVGRMYDELMGVALHGAERERDDDDGPPIAFA